MSGASTPSDRMPDALADMAASASALIFNQIQLDLLERHRAAQMAATERLEAILAKWGNS